MLATDSFFNKQQINIITCNRTLILQRQHVSPVCFVTERLRREETDLHIQHSEGNNTNKNKLERSSS